MSAKVTRPHNHCTQAQDERWIVTTADEDGATSVIDKRDGGSVLVDDRADLIQLLTLMTLCLNRGKTFQSE